MIDKDNAVLDTFDYLDKASGKAENYHGDG